MANVCSVKPLSAANTKANGLRNMAMTNLKKNSSKNCALNFVDTKGGEPYVIPLGEMTTHKKTSNSADQNRGKNVLVPIIPMCYASTDYSIYSAQRPRKGWIYIFKNGFLWRELYSTGSGKFKDVKLTKYAGEDERKAYIVADMYITVPHLVDGKSQEIEICFSENQWSWARVNRYGGMDPEDYRIRHKGGVVHAKQQGVKPSDSKLIRDERFELVDFSGISSQFSKRPKYDPKIRKAQIIPMGEVSKYKVNGNLSYMFLFTHAKSKSPILYMKDPVGIARSEHDKIANTITHINANLGMIRGEIAANGKRIDIPTITGKDKKKKQQEARNAKSDFEIASFINGYLYQGLERSLLKNMELRKKKDTKVNAERAIEILNKRKEGHRDYVNEAALFNKKLQRESFYSMINDVVGYKSSLVNWVDIKDHGNFSAAAEDYFASGKNGYYGGVHLVAKLMQYLNDHPAGHYKALIKSYQLMNLYYAIDKGPDLFARMFGVAVDEGLKEGSSRKSTNNKKQAVPHRLHECIFPQHVKGGSHNVLKYKNTNPPLGTPLFNTTLFKKWYKEEYLAYRKKYRLESTNDKQKSKAQALKNPDDIKAKDLARKFIGVVETLLVLAANRPLNDITRGKLDKDQLEKAIKKYKDTVVLVRQAEIDLQKAEADKTYVSDRVAGLRNDLSTAIAERDALKLQKSENEAERDKMRQDLKDKNQSVKDARAAYVNTRKMLLSKEKELNALKKEILDLEARAETLNNRLQTKVKSRMIPAERINSMVTELRLEYENLQEKYRLIYKEISFTDLLNQKYPDDIIPLISEETRTRLSELRNLLDEINPSEGHAVDVKYKNSHIGQVLLSDITSFSSGLREAIKHIFQHQKDGQQVKGTTQILAAEKIAMSKNHKDVVEEEKKKIETESEKIRNQGEEVKTSEANREAIQKKIDEPPQGHVDKIKGTIKRFELKMESSLKFHAVMAVASPFLWCWEYGNLQSARRDYLKREDNDSPEAFKYNLALLDMAIATLAPIDTAYRLYQLYSTPKIVPGAPVRGGFRTFVSKYNVLKALGPLLSVFTVVSSASHMSEEGTDAVAGFARGDMRLAAGSSIAFGGLMLTIVAVIAGSLLLGLIAAVIILLGAWIKSCRDTPMESWLGQGPYGKNPYGINKKWKENHEYIYLALMNLIYAPSIKLEPKKQKFTMRNQVLKSGAMHHGPIHKHKLSAIVYQVKVGVSVVPKKKDFDIHVELRLGGKEAQWQKINLGRLTDKQKKQFKASNVDLTEIWAGVVFTVDESAGAYVCQFRDTNFKTLAEHYSVFYLRVRAKYYPKGKGSYLFRNSSLEIGLPVREMAHANQGEIIDLVDVVEISGSAIRKSIQTYKTKVEEYGRFLKRYSKTFNTLPTKLTYDDL